MPSWLLHLLRALAWITLALGVAAGLLYLQAVGGSQYQPVVQASLGLGCLAIGYLLGQALRSLGHRRAPVPLSIDAPLPPVEGTGRLWARGFAAGFWALCILGMAASLFRDFVLRLTGLMPRNSPSCSCCWWGCCSASPFPSPSHVECCSVWSACRWSTTAASVTACAAGWALVVALYLLLFLLQDPGLADLLVPLLALTR